MKRNEWMIRFVRRTISAILSFALGIFLTVNWVGMLGEVRASNRDVILIFVVIIITFGLTFLFAFLAFAIFQGQLSGKRKLGEEEKDYRQKIIDEINE